MRLRPSYASLAFWTAVYLGSLLGVAAFGSWFSAFLVESAEPAPVEIVDDIYPDRDCDEFKGKPREFAACYGYE